MNPAKLFTTIILFLFLLGCQKETSKTVETIEKPSNTSVKTEIYLNNWIHTKFESETDKANAFFERVFQDNLKYNPEMKSYLGIKTDNDKWNDISDTKAKQDLDRLKNHLNKLKKHIDFEKLDHQSKISYRLFVNSSQQEIDNFKYRFHNYPVNQMFGLQSAMPSFMINMHRIDSVNDAQAYITRLKTIKKKFETLSENLMHRLELGISAPKFVYSYVISDSENLLKGRPFDSSDQDSTLLADFKKKVMKLGLDEIEVAELIQQASTALGIGVKPAYEGLIKTVKEIETKASEDGGAWKFPEGEEFYNSALKITTTTDLSADEIHNIGKFEVARIHAEMRKIMKEVSFKGDLQQFFEFMRTDDQFYKENTDQGRVEYLAENVAVIDLMKSKLDSLFLTVPKAELEVKAVEKFREKSAGKAFYNRPSMDGSRPGTYYVNLYNMADMPTYQMEALAHHEGIPGHHMQLAIAQELESLPKFRKFARYTAYSEGWGLYSEFLPKEIGAYEDPYSDFGRLAMELWRSCRLVVDTGIHAKKWTRQQGIDYYMENTPNPIGDAIKMVERHIVAPSQATAYKIGMLKILELRKKAYKALGRFFDIREFHDVVLTNGPVPLNLLEELIDEWIELKRQVQE